jgi:hypothetical protein
MKTASGQLAPLVPRILGSHGPGGWGHPGQYIGSGVLGQSAPLAFYFKDTMSVGSVQVRPTRALRNGRWPGSRCAHFQGTPRGPLLQPGAVGSSGRIRRRDPVRGIHQATPPAERPKAPDHPAEVAASMAGAARAALGRQRFVTHGGASARVRGRFPARCGVSPRVRAVGPPDGRPTRRAGVVLQDRTARWWRPKANARP